MRRGLIFGRMHMQRHPLPTYFYVKPDYPVLAPLSRSYPKSEGRLPTRYSPVRHSTHPRRDFLVRLACVRHAASVHSEPESNSPVTYNLKQPCCSSNLIQVLPNPTRYLFVKDPFGLSARRKSLYRPPSSLSTTFLFFFQFPAARPSRQAGAAL